MAAIRSARSRRRQRLGLRILLVELDEWRTINTLIDRGIITEDEALDPRAVSRALERILDAWVSSP